MGGKYTKEQFWKLYQKLPQELKDALFAEETGDSIYNICKRNEIEENLGEIVDYVGQVLVGLLAPEDFQSVLEKELRLEEDVAKKVTHEINRFIFYPVKESLDALSLREVISPEEALKIISEKAPRPKKKEGIDIYREPIE